MKKNTLVLTFLMAFAGQSFAAEQAIVYKAGHPSLKQFLLPKEAPAPDDNKPTPARIELGKNLYFDTRLSGDASISCASCHNPSLGWADGQKTAVGFKGEILGRASPTVINTAYNSIQMWDGRKKSLEDQASGPMEAEKEMNANMPQVYEFLKGNATYKAMFEKAYPDEEIGKDTVTKAIATFERTVVISNNAPFDRWVKGDKKAMTPQQIEGFKLFNGKANCVVCHSGPNFTDNGFHNLGLASHDQENPDMGRYAHKKLPAMKGAFKTPTLREAEQTAPYFHDGSAKTLMAVVEHYSKGGETTKDLSPNIRPLNLTQGEKESLVAFMKSLTGPHINIAYPNLPK